VRLALKVVMQNDGDFVDEIPLYQCFCEICCLHFRVAPTGNMKAAVSCYVLQSAWCHNQNSVIFEIQYFSTELRVSCY
jgi:hypothetical protein